MNFVKRDVKAVNGASAVESAAVSDFPAVSRFPAPTAAAHKWPISYESIELISVIADVVVIFSASTLAGVIYHMQAYGTPGDIFQYFGTAGVVSALFVSLMKSRRMYKPAALLALRNQLRTIVLLWTAVFLLLAGTVFTLKVGTELSRGASLLFAALGLAALVVHRVFWRSLLTKGMTNKRFSGRRIVLITDCRHQIEAGLAHNLANLGFTLERHFRLPPPERGRHQRADMISRAIACVRGSEVEEIVVGTDLKNWTDLRGLIAELRILPFPVNLIPVGTASEIFNQPSHELGNSVCVEVQRGPLTSLEYAAKRCIDIVFAGTGLLVLLPLLAVVAVAIKLDSPGPVLFRQRRCGFNGKCFQIYKFRTMSVLEDGATITQAQCGDSRITPLGRWLRRTSADELPQLLNVLEGSMSLVGPRPHAVAHDTQFDKVVRNYAFRRRVKPGLTGWAQVHGYRGPTPTPEDIERRVEHDLWYIDNWSFGLDLAIMLQTVVEVARSRNAY
ncbi:MAG: undecaprenyl-phosphate glucose phosphotransferase [Afipia sp.]|nr:undecaprenyl-phosphate glucose phosphotransferase [Afipia sp.]OJW64401.1 MAG: undecaprenyl-phosphate glucose phosphotransferase [Afipia sp. 64-13]